LVLKAEKEKQRHIFFCIFFKDYHGNRLKEIYEFTWLCFYIFTLSKLNQCWLEFSKNPYILIYTNLQTNSPTQHIQLHTINAIVTCMETAKNHLSGLFWSERNTFSSISTTRTARVSFVTKFKRTVSPPPL